MTSLYPNGQSDALLLLYTGIHAIRSCIPCLPLLLNMYNDFYMLVRVIAEGRFRFSTGARSNRHAPPMDLTDVLTCYILDFLSIPCRNQASRCAILTSMRLLVRAPPQPMGGGGGSLYCSIRGWGMSPA